MHHHRQGKCTEQGHKAIPEGHFEEEQGLKGFFGRVSHLIRPNPITSWTEVQGPLRPHMYDPVQWEKSARYQRMLFNSTVEIGYLWTSPLEGTELEAFRSGDGDQLLFCHSGEGQIFTEYGSLAFRPGQYVVIPKSLAYVIDSKGPAEFLVVENLNSHYEEPDRGMVGRHVPYDPNALVKPDLEKQRDLFSQMNYEVRSIQIKRLGQLSTFMYDQNVFDVVGWKGDLYPFSLHMDQIMPLMSHRVHLPPSAHTTFVAKDFVVCSFLPRPLEQDSDALKVPFYHQNIDYDEVLFYHEGDFFSRDNLHAGMMSFHPAGFPHGPHPKAVKSIDHKTATNEKAVMVDTRWPLLVDESLKNIEFNDYWKSWQTK